MEKSEDELLLEHVPTDGAAIGNARLQRELGWEEARYWRVRNGLVDRGEIEAWRGRGGSVRRVVSVAGGEPKTAPEVATARESDLYPPIARVLEEKWTKDERVESAIVQITAQQGSRLTGGRWTRPDVTVATLSTYPYVPGRHFDVVTFEIKPSDALDVTCVYEALAHLRSATRAYVLLQVPESPSADVEDVLLEIAAEAKKHGIGVLTFERADDYDTWDERVEPVRREPEPRKLNDFLAKQFAAKQLEQIVRWFR